MSSAPRVATADDPVRAAPAVPVPCYRPTSCPIGSASWGPTAGDPVRGVPAGPMPAAGARAADELGAQGDHCR
ncbi:hypothetical protein ACUZ8Y_23020 [Aeromonas veronii]|uniref:hypothetical protein n=1 Tax=Aeromonas veronii TaxID=654 RepID=UPI00406BB724